MKIIKENEPRYITVGSLIRGDFFEHYERLCQLILVEEKDIYFRIYGDPNNTSGSMPPATLVKEVEIISIKYRVKE